MTAVFTTFFREILFTSLDKTDPLDPSVNLFAPPKNVYWVFFRSHASFTDTNDSRYTGIKTVSELTGKLGWSPAITPRSSSQPVGTSTVSDNTYVLANNDFDMGANWAETTVTAAALVLEGTYNPGGVVDPIIYLTDTPFVGDIVMSQADSLIARPVPALAGNRSLFSWPVYFIPPSPAPPPTSVQPVEGSVAVQESPPPFEAAYNHHAWLYPQRVNMLANPSFETLVGSNHWRTNGSFTKMMGTPTVPVAPGGSVQNTHYAKITGSAPLVIESNIFPLDIFSANGLWTIQAMLRGTGRVRVALLTWDPDFIQTGADWGDTAERTEVWSIPGSGWLHLYALRHSYDSAWGMVRIECDGGEMHLDNMLCEPDWLKDWRYFDGDSTYGARDDHSWYGGENRKGTTYSCWYNHRRAVIGRLFAYDIDANDFTITDEEVEEQGFVYKWIPAGVRVVAHQDVLWPEDIQEVVPNNAGTPVTAYDNGTNGGAPNPWAPFQYLRPSTGTVSTPDTAADAPTGDFTVVAKFKLGAMGATTKVITTQRLATTQISWMMATTDRNIWLRVSTTGTSFTSTTIFGALPSGLVTGDVVTVACSVDVDDGAAHHIVTTNLLVDGEWVTLGAPLVIASAITRFDSTANIMVGAQPGGTPATYDSDITWVEFHKGLDPDAGEVVWRFDAADANPSSTTVVGDEDGRTWTLTSAAAIGR